MKKFILIQLVLIGALFSTVKAQTTAVEKNTYTIARLAVRFMNANLPDSVYLLTGDYFRSQIPQATWATVYNSQLSALIPFSKVEFIKSMGNVNVYKLTGKVLLTYNVSIDAKNKIENFSFVPFQP